MKPEAVRDELSDGRGATGEGRSLRTAPDLAGEIVVYGSGQLVRGLVERDLVDEWRLTLHPVVLGTGARFFGETSGKTPLRLLSTRRVGDGLVHLTYERVRA